MDFSKAKWEDMENKGYDFKENILYYRPLEHNEVIEDGDIVIVSQYPIPKWFPSNPSNKYNKNDRQIYRRKETLYINGIPQNSF